VDADELIRIYRESLSDIRWEGPTNPERIKQYKHVWPSEEEFIKDVEHRPTGVLMEEFTDQWLTRIKDYVVSRNPGLSEESGKAILVPINSFAQFTGTRMLHGGVPLILVDSGLMKFIWVMNKALVYGQDSGEFSRNHLTCMTLLMYAIYLRPPERLKREIPDLSFSTPPTPPHSDKSTLISLTFETWLHELFVIAHEIAHIELGHLTKGAGGARGSFTPLPVSPLASVFVKDVSSVEEELAADDLALDLCIEAVLKGEHSAGTRDIVQRILTSIYQASRYFLWLEMVLKADAGEAELPWAARHFQLRSKIDSVYKWGSPTFIADHLDWLEENMEPGAFRAAELYNDLLTEEERSNGGGGST